MKVNIFISLRVFEVNLTRVSVKGTIRNLLPLFQVQGCLLRKNKLYLCTINVKVKVSDINVGKNRYEVVGARAQYTTFYSRNCHEYVYFVASVEFFLRT